MNADLDGDFLGDLRDGDFFDIFLNLGKGDLLIFLNLDGDGDLLIFLDLEGDGDLLIFLDLEGDLLICLDAGGGDGHGDSGDVCLDDSNLRSFNK